MVTWACGEPLPSSPICSIIAGEAGAPSNGCDHVAFCPWTFCPDGAGTRRRYARRYVAPCANDAEIVDRASTRGLRRRVSRRGQKLRRFDRDRGRSEAAYRKRAVSRRRIDRGVRRDRQQQRVLESSVPSARHRDVHDRRLHRTRHCRLGRRSIETRADEI